MAKSPPSKGSTTWSPGAGAFIGFSLTAAALWVAAVTLTYRFVESSETRVGTAIAEVRDGIGKLDSNLDATQDGLAQVRSDVAAIRVRTESIATEQQAQQRGDRELLAQTAGQQAQIAQLIAQVQALEARVFDLNRPQRQAEVVSPSDPRELLEGRPVTQDRLELADAEPENWLSVHQNYSNQRFSRLMQINRANVHDLQRVATISLPPSAIGVARPVFGTPLVDSGIMFIEDGWANVYAFDVREGPVRLLWAVRSDVNPERVPPIARGIALWGTLVLVQRPDGNLEAINRMTGELVWTAHAALSGLAGPNPVIYSDDAPFQSAPLVANSRALVSAFDGLWGAIVAYDARTGAEAWRFNTLPGPGEPGYETWRSSTQFLGGGRAGLTGAYSPAVQTVFWGTGTAFPHYVNDVRPGDNLHTSSVVALDIDSGKLKWSFQLVPNESWPYGAEGANVLFPAEPGGGRHSVLGHFARNGFFYQLDRQSGAFRQSTQWANEVTWTRGIDPKSGKPFEYQQGEPVQTYGARSAVGGDAPKPRVCPPLSDIPSPPPPSAYDPVQGRLFSIGNNCTSMEVATELNPGNAPLLGYRGEANRPALRSSLVAVDVRSGRRLAHLELDSENHSGLLATAGGLLFTGGLNGLLKGFDANDLREVISLSVGAPVVAPPMSYSVGGTQYIAVAVGDTVTGEIPRAPPPLARNFSPDGGGLTTKGALLIFALPQKP